MKNITHKIQSSKIVSKFSYAVTKRIIDIFGGSILFILFIPVYIIIVIIIKIDSRDAVLYKWHVVGKNGVPFISWKFRTMVPKADEIKINLSDKNEMVGPVFKIENDPGINNRAMNYPRGKTLGGSSSINGLLYIRGQSNDYNYWRQLGNVGWSWEDVLPYFKKSEDFEFGKNEFSFTLPIAKKTLTFKMVIYI